MYAVPAIGDGPMFESNHVKLGFVVKSGLLDPEFDDVFTNIVTMLLASDPSMLKLPTASENLLLPTLTTPGIVLLAVGVKVAV